MNAPDARNPLLRHGAVGSAVVVALLLLAVFYSIVHGAVDRASQRRAAARLEASAELTPPVRRLAPAVQVQAVRPALNGPRSVSYIRSVN